MGNEGIEIPEKKPNIDFVERPWGNFFQYINNGPCTVSLMTVMPGQRTSLQSHKGRAELWIVLDDDVLVQVGDDIRSCKAGDEVWIPARERHRLNCEGNQPKRVLEIAFGDWEQNDIVRYEDDYNR